METGDEKREAVEFPRTHRCPHEGRDVRDKTVADCYRCMRASRAPFGNDDAPCDLDGPGPGMWRKLADPIEGKNRQWQRLTRCRYACDRS